MCLKEIDADINPFHHVEEIRLKDKRLSWVVQHTSSVFQLLEVF